MRLGACHRDLEPAADGLNFLDQPKPEMITPALEQGLEGSRLR
jgi:hypothetical protein